MSNAEAAQYLLHACAVREECERVSGGREVFGSALMGDRVGRRDCGQDGLGRKEGSGQ